MGIAIDVLNSGDYNGSVGYILSGYYQSDSKTFEITHPKYSYLYDTGVNYIITLNESGSESSVTGYVNLGTHNPYSMTIEKVDDDIAIYFQTWENYGTDNLPTGVQNRFATEALLGLTPTQVSGLFWKYCGLMYENQLSNIVPGYHQIVWSGF